MRLSPLPLALVTVAMAASAAAAQLQNENLLVTVPDGFKIELFAIVPDARHMAVGPSTNMLFVGTRKTTVWAVTDRNSDMTADEVKPFAPSLNFKVPNGVCWTKDGFLIVVHVDAVALRVHQLVQPVAALGAQELVEEHVSEKAIAGIDHEHVKERIRRVRLQRVVDVVEQLACGPERGRRHHAGLHEAPGRALRVIERTSQGDAVNRGQRVQHLALLVGGQVFKDGQRVVVLKIMHALDDGLGRQFVENVLADRIIDFGQSRKVEIAPHQLNEPRPQVVLKRLKHGAKV